MRYAPLLAIVLALSSGCLDFGQTARFVLVRDGFVVEANGTIEAFMGPHCAEAVYQTAPEVALEFRSTSPLRMRAPDLVVLRAYTGAGPLVTFASDRIDTMLPAYGDRLALASPIDASLVLLNLTIEQSGVRVEGNPLADGGAKMRREYAVAGAAVSETFDVRDFGEVPIRVRHVGLCD